MPTNLAQWVFSRKLPLLASIVCALLCYFISMPWLHGEAEPSLRMSAGSRLTRRDTVAMYLREQAASNQLSIQLSDNAGTEECLQQVKRGQLDAAIVSSGVVVPEDDDIMVLAAMELEPVHVLVRKSLVTDAPLAEEIRGKRVNVGVRGSSEWLLSRTFLEFAGIKLPSEHERGEIVPIEHSKTELINRARAIMVAKGEEKQRLIADLPDCVLLQSTMPSTVVLSLVEAADYEIVALPATRAFLLDNLQDSHSKHTVIEREFLEPAVIPAHSYFAGRPFPAKDCETVGVRLLVVAHKHVSANAIRPLMETIFEGEFARRILPTSPRELSTPYAIHPAAEAYFDREKPLLIRELVEYLSTALSIFGAFSAGMLSLYGLVWRKQTRKPADYYAEIHKLELLARNLSADSSTYIQRHELARYLHDRLLKLRHELIEDICEGRIEGDQVIANILGLLNDSRQHLPPVEHVPFASGHLSTPLDRPRMPIRRAG